MPIKSLSVFCPVVGQELCAFWYNRFHAHTNAAVIRILDVFAVRTLAVVVDVLSCTVAEFFAIGIDDQARLIPDCILPVVAIILRLLQPCFVLSLRREYPSLVWENQTILQVDELSGEHAQVELSALEPIALLDLQFFRVSSVLG